MSDDVLAAARGLVGPLELVADRSWTHLGLAVVLEIETASGERLLVKRHAPGELFDQEVHAYEHWVPAIADRAPRLVAIDAEARLLVLTRLTGAVPALDPAVHRDAGRVLRRFHDAEPGHVDTDWAAARLASLERWVGRAPDGLLARDDIDWARCQLQLLAELPPPTVVPVHGDWQPRNWLEDRGEVQVFDFERAGWSWWIHDLQRMWWREWVDRPDLADSFFEGYGRALTDLERTALLASSGAGHVVQVAWARLHNDPQFAEAGRRNLAFQRGH